MGEEEEEVEAAGLSSGWRMWKRWGTSLEMLSSGGMEILEGREEERAERDS